MTVISSLLTAVIPTAVSAHMLSTVRVRVGLRATPTTMYVESWYDQGTRLTADQVVASSEESGNENKLPAGMSASAAAASPQLLEKALTYEADIAKMQARLDEFPPDARGTMVGLLRDQLRVSELVLAKTLDAAAAADRPPRKEAYFCNDQGCWIAEQYFCDETGCYITTDLPPDVTGKVVPTPKKAKEGKPEKVVVQQGIFAPAVKLSAQVMGRKELNAFRASVIGKHTKVISAFVDTSESKFGQIALKSLFEAADKDGSGGLDKEEVKEALQAMGFKFIEDKDVDKIFKKADADNDEVIDFEEFIKETPKTLRVSLVKLARENGHDLGFLA